jgi:hypothetical protein
MNGTREVTLASMLLAALQRDHGSWTTVTLSAYIRAAASDSAGDDVRELITT